MSAITLRRPEHRDITWLAAQMREFNTFFNGKHSLIPPEPGALETRLRGFVDTPDTYPWLIADRNGLGPVGFVGGILHEHFFNPNIRVLSELFWWVIPSERNSWAGYRLLQAFTLFGQANADMIIMTLEADSPVKYGTLERLGYRVKETNFLLET